MSYCIDEGISDAHEALKVRKQIKDQFPDATFQTRGLDWQGRERRVWVSESLQVEDCDSFEIKGGDKPDMPQFLLFKQCDGFRVYPAHCYGYLTFTIFRNLQEKDPGLYQQLVEAVKKHG